MAKKKSKKKAGKKKRATKKASKKATKKKAKKSTSPPKKSAAKSSGGKSSRSLDAIMKKHEKERVSKESLLLSTQKKIEGLESKRDKLNTEISKLKESERNTSEEISAIATKRDAEVNELLTKMGVQLGGSSAASSPPVPDPTPEPEPDEETEDFDANGENESEGENGDSDAEPDAAE